ncbi:MAG: hypothetical protein AAB521_02780 [Patescibacteria group bacterium]
MVKKEITDPRLCINSYVVEVTNGRGYCSDTNRKNFRNEENGCDGCPKLNLSSQIRIVNKRQLMSSEEFVDSQFAADRYTDTSARLDKRRSRPRWNNFGD